MPEHVVEDFDPSFDLSQAAHWLLKAADYADVKLRNHPKKEKILSEARSGAIGMAQLHGHIQGAISVFEAQRALNDEASFRIVYLKHQYTNHRAELVDGICRLYIDALVMERDVNSKPGRPRKRMPDYEALESMTDSESIARFVQYAQEFSIAVQLVENKKTTGKFTGLKTLLDEAVEAGKIDDQGDTAQRIKRLARQLHEDSALHLSPGLREARENARQFIYSTE